MWLQLAYLSVQDWLPYIPADVWWSSTPLQQFTVQLTLSYVLVDTVFVSGCCCAVAVVENANVTCRLASLAPFSAQVFMKWESVGGYAMLFHHMIFPFSYGIGLYYLKPAFGLYCMLVLQVRYCGTASCYDPFVELLLLVLRY